MSKAARIHQSQRSVVAPEWGGPHCRRQLPADFRERYIELGWEAIGDHYRASWRVIVRWIDQAGRDDLREARAAYVKRHGLTMLHPVK